MKLKIRYNSPVVLTFSLICIGVYIIDLILSAGMGANTIGPLTANLFMLSGTFNWYNPLDYLRLFTYTMGHADQAHIMGNMSIFLLIAPIMEEKYGSRNILIMMLITSLMTAAIQILLFDYNLLGASGIVFMFIVLVSFADARKGTIPLTFILVTIFFLGQELLQSLQVNQVSEFTHLAGGFFGGIFGYIFKEADPKNANLSSIDNEWLNK